MHICMTKVISISDEAYDLLKRLKINKSFSEIIIAISREKNKSELMKFAGMIGDKEGRNIKKSLYEHRKIPSRRFE